MKMMKLTAVMILIAVASGLAAPAAQARATGVPLDSEYLVFVIDTSGSMRRYEWDRVQQMVAATLEAHPFVAGFQVMSDEGRHLMLSTVGEWLPNTSQVRSDVLERLESWDAFSNSSPRNGILDAIETYDDGDKKISLYVYSDDFSSGTAAIGAVVREVDASNVDLGGRRRVRINAVAFPIFYDVTSAMGTGGDYATLMLSITQHNGGSFVGLSSRDNGPLVMREPLTGLGTGYDRTLIVIDASAPFAGSRWDQAVATVTELAGSLEPSAEVQIVALAGEPRVLTAGTAGGWIRADDAGAIAAALDALRALTPSGETDLDTAAALAASQVSAGDRVVLLAGGLPTVSSETGSVAGSEQERYSLFLAAARQFPAGIPVDVLLLAGDREPLAAQAYWSLALRTGGALVAPAEDWP